MINAKGQWFNGITAKPLEVDLIFDDKLKTLILQHGDHLVNWNLSDINIQSSLNSLHIYNQLWPSESVFTNDSLFAREISRYVNNKRDNWYFRLLHAGLKIHLLISAGILIVATIFYFLFVPWLSERAVAIIPVEYDKELAALAFDDFIRNEESDSILTILVQSFCNELKVESHTNFKITVVESDQINAFALPDGNIVVYSAILKSMNDYTELAGLLAHETAHIKNRHSMKMLSRSLSVYFVLSVILSDVNGLMMAMAQNADQLNMLSYSRNFEQEADEDGFRIMRNNHLNPNGMVKLFEKLEKENVNFSIPEFLNTHPLTKQRIKSVKNLIKNGNYSFRENKKMKMLFDEIKKKLSDEKPHKKTGL